MGTLRAKNFDKLLDIYAEIKNFIKRCDYRLKSAMQKIYWKLCNLTKHQANDEKYWEHLEYAATRLHILFNSKMDKEIKIIIQKIYDKIIEILPDNFQLLIFAEEIDFRWDFKVDPQNWGKYGIRYIPNKIWDNLAKYIYSFKSQRKPTITAESEYIQISLNLM